MALTVTALTAAPYPLYSAGDLKLVLYTITFDSSYATGGETLTAGTIGLSTVVYSPMAICPKVSGQTDAVIAWYDIANSKLQAFWANAGSASALLEVTSTQDISGYAGVVAFWGR